MAKLIPTIGSCVPRMTPGEKRFAYRLEEKLDDDYLCWYDVAIGDRAEHPDFIIFHPNRGLLILEVKDWKPDTLLRINKQQAEILTAQGPKMVENPLEQARRYMFAMTNELERDPLLVSHWGKYKGKLIFPYGHGVVFTNISRRQFEATGDAGGLGDVLLPHLVIYQDEMTESVDAEVFQQRLWAMITQPFGVSSTTLRIDRIRWHIFPEIRIPSQGGLPAEKDSSGVEIPDDLRVMDVDQERLARSLGEGHRVIHGVAGSGKTLILMYRAKHLAEICQRPILVLCYNKTLATKLRSDLDIKGLRGKVRVVNFHAWCARQLKAYNIDMPPKGDNADAFFAACVERVIGAIEQKRIPPAQYDAVLIDEGHDFKPEWFKLVVQMINPDTKSLLVLYDDAQSIYSGSKKLRFSFSSVGIQAQGRTQILTRNYRNTAEILAVAKAFADDLLSASDSGEDQAPTVQPISAGRHGEKPLLIKLPTLKDEAVLLVSRLIKANKSGIPWNEMAVIYRRYGIGQQVADILTHRKIPFQWQQDRQHSYVPAHDSIKLITMHSSKGLEFPLVCIPAIGAPLTEGDDVQDEARLLYVAMTRATQELVMTYSDTSVLSEKMYKAMKVLDKT